ncbi:MAG: hypothetical protein P4L53_09215 [Candidatus Obscuribacterales bacterium]|nr:hypothetical protein [Candidatus Obscuribacterales bacterium]
MLCTKHPTTLKGAAEIMDRACSDCGNLTYSDCQICAQCSKGYDECQRCRAPLNSYVDPRKLAAFTSPLAQEIRKNKLLARETFLTKKHDAERNFTVCTAEYRNLVREQIAPHQLICEKACKPHRDKVAAVSESLGGELADDNLMFLQKSVIHPRLKEAIEKCDAACLSIQDKYEHDVKGFFAAYRKAIRPANASLKRQVANAQDEMNQRIRSLDDQLEILLYRSTRIRYMVLGAISDFFRGILRPKR